MEKFELQITDRNGKVLHEFASAPIDFSHGSRESKMQSVIDGLDDTKDSSNEYLTKMITEKNDGIKDNNDLQKRQKVV
jgi:hypothetical protein